MSASDSSGREAGADGQKPNISDEDVQRIADYLRKSEGERRLEASFGVAGGIWNACHGGSLRAIVSLGSKSSQ